jgi:gamma-glutamyltranspeptidase/glutathione hydrolase
MKIPFIQSMFFIFILFFLFGLAGCKSPQEPKNLSNRIATGNQAMVVSPHPISTNVGLEVLKNGGNAVDATVAIHFSMAVVYPRAGNLGGGGFMVIRLQDGNLASLDYREMAPAAAQRNMYLDSTGQVIEGLSLSGYLASGVPGTVAGLLEAWQKYGSRPLEELLEPAILLAEKGFSLTTTEAERLNRFQKAFQRFQVPDHPFIHENWQPGDTLKQLKLAETLKLILKNGKDGFYQGNTATAIAQAMKKNDGLITLDDLAQYRPVWREPVTGNYRNFRIISMPPPSSGGVALIQILKMIEQFPFNKFEPDSPDYIHLLAEAERRAYADRAQYLGDADFYPVPIDSLLSDSYLEQRMESFIPDQASQSSDFQGEIFHIRKESFETTHTSVVDAEGNAVSTTTTLNSNFGSKVWVAGFFLNNEMDDFSLKPGVPNQFGLVGAEANAVAPGKRMLSSMTPTIIEKERQLYLVLGSPGGSTIITSILQVFLKVAEFGLNLPDAVASARFHHQWLPDQIMLEADLLDSAGISELKKLGHEVKMVERMGVVKAILVEKDGSLIGAGDPRNPDDTALGY